MKCKVLSRHECQNRGESKIRIDLNHWTYDHRPERPEIFVSVHINPEDNRVCCECGNDESTSMHIHVDTIEQGLVILNALAGSSNIF